ncbi:hypothetical protein ACIBF1_35245 [Spirillospora sp. NPDC050679]
MAVVATGVAGSVDDPTASRWFLTAYLGVREVLVINELAWLTRDDGAADTCLRQCPSAELPFRSAVVTVSGIIAVHPRLCREGVTVAAPLRLVVPNGLEIELVEWIEPAGG